MRKRLVRRETGGVRFVTFSCFRRLPLLSNPRIADLFAAELARVRREHGMRLYAWVAMPEHVHLMAQPMDGVTLERSLRSIKVALARRVVHRWRAMRASILDTITTDAGAVRCWQYGGGFERNVGDGSEFIREVCSIHRNPVERGLVARSEDWRWSSVRWWGGTREGECDPPPATLAKRLAWNHWENWK